MITVAKQQVLAHLESKMTMITQTYKPEDLTIMQQLDIVDMIKIGYQIKQHGEYFFIFQKYMDLKDETLLPFTPIWSIEKVESPSHYSRGFDNLTDGLNEIFLKNSRKIIS